MIALAKLSQPAFWLQCPKIHGFTPAWCGIDAEYIFRAFDQAIGEQKLLLRSYCIGMVVSRSSGLQSIRPLPSLPPRQQQHQPLPQPTGDKLSRTHFSVLPFGVTFL
jgi:hypothetical protein